ncbi:hypothetical protein [Pseudobacter ginsenosidimutans]|uniref:PA14 domain-containing protein n=1 Tax=Pseudobacter ginsenosidimutans TaxID=661488 RepID=A0A4Q7N5E3_9BACT|nr:hypothetical protein [Pseudobacter ginsenosidimutans]QEC44787.1 hypothetical protein FSB84_25040 [Pseudobacter ginsenosidimutans]RZS76274.1 hypothetical protein EV199_2154 [Pseudobacter ginsenosidimutans]
MKTKRSRKITAWFFLITLSIQTLWPSMAWAITEGPSQPEMSKFEPVGASELVDLFTGDMKYNIPLMDVGGYPLNLSYSSGTGIDDEASWVGAGWTLNPGAVTRNMRGLPDDFKGDQIVKEYTRKEFKKIGGKIVVKPTIFGWEIGKVASFKIGVYKDNYYGIGADIGASLGFSQAIGGRSAMTAGLDFTSDSRTGVNLRPSLSLSVQRADREEAELGSISGSFAYNTRGGLKQVSLGTSFSPFKIQGKVPKTELSATHYFGQSYTPEIKHNTFSHNEALSFDGGITGWGVYGGLGGEGYMNTEKIKEKVSFTPAYGYLNYLDGKKNPHGLLDFNREKDGTFLPGAPSIAIPVATQDFFMASSQAGSRQFRPHYGGNYVVYDKPHGQTTLDNRVGITFGAGWIKKAGGRWDITASSAETGKWSNHNGYLGAAETPFTDNPNEEKMYFKQSGELSVSDKKFFGKFHNTTTQRVGLARVNNGRTIGTTQKLVARGGIESAVSDIRKVDREVRTTTMSFLNAIDASKYGLDKKIKNTSHTGQNVDIERVALNLREQHHISEMTVTDNEGKRIVYGIPVYNNFQQEVSFSVAGPSNASAMEKARRTGQIAYQGLDNTLANDKGREKLFSRERVPSYATSWLLTGILSPDYIDRTNDGITDDDYGTAIKFQYKQHATDYKWRAPYAANTANYNEGFLSDVKDDKASYTFGEKEVWYLTRVVGNKMTAVFYTSPRQDGLGVAGHNGGKDEVLKLLKLDSIRLYTDVEMKKDEADRIPIKVAHFEYDYSLNPNMPNNTGACVQLNNTAAPDCNDITSATRNINFHKGKLTLKKVYFTFGENRRGKSHPYVFHYDNRPLSEMGIPGLPAIPSNDEEYTDNYNLRQVDRWGTYKKSFFNRQKQGGTSRKLNNSEYPYTLQADDQAGYDVRKLTDWFASHWQLNKIETPSGAIINVEYEADDYAHVQDRRAMRMFNVVGIKTPQGIIENVEVAAGMIGATGLVVELPKNVSSVAEFRDNYLKGADGEFIDKVFYRVLTDIDNVGHFEYVQGHAAIDPNPNNYLWLSASKVVIPLLPVGGASPMSYGAWQTLKSDLPQYAFSGYDNSDSKNFEQDFKAAIRAIVKSATTMRELFQSFETTAKNRECANKINLHKSFVRLYCHPEQPKTGGGTRVKQVTISDEWNLMGRGTAEKTVTGTLYSYTTTSGGKTVSSGVAAYEPQIGNEENPFREPVNFTEKVHWGTSRYHYIEKPFGETFFPAPVVGYSKVRVTAVGDDWLRNRSNASLHTGYIENEFYTAKEFPTIVDNLPLDYQKYENNMIARLFTCTAITRVANSQGFKVELNDMHGKQKAVNIFNKGGDKIGYTEYYYNTVDEKAAVKELNNNVQVVGPDGKIEESLLATDIDFTTDVRQSYSQAIGTGIGTYLGFFTIPTPFGPIPIPYGALNSAPSISIENYNAVSAVKVVNRYGLVKKVRTMKDGSVLEAENLVWDAETGNVLLSSSQNEFNDKIYSFNYPAYWAEGNEGMQGAYKNLGACIELTSDATSGILSTPIPANQSYLNALNPGDELVSVNGDLHGWIYKYGSYLMLMDKAGAFLKPNGLFQVFRSGKRNLTGASAGTVTMMKDPRVFNGVDTRIVITEDKRILDAKATVYKDEWPMPLSDSFEIKKVVKPINQILCIEPLIFGLISQKVGTGPRAILNTSNVIARDILIAGNDPEDFKPLCADNKNYTNNIPTDLNTTFYHLHQSRTDENGLKTILPGDKATIGQFKIVFDEISAGFVAMINQTITQDQMQYKLYNYNGAGDGYEYIVVREEAVSNVKLNLPWAPGPYVLLSRKIDCIRENPDDWDDFYKPIGCYTDKLLTFHLEAENDLLMDVEVCSPASDFYINPYYEGISGNWRPLHNYAYSTERVQTKGLPYLQGSTDIRNSGYYKTYDPFWLFNNQKLTTSIPGNINAPAQKWIWGDQAIYFDKRSNGIEAAAHRITNGEPVVASDPDRVYSSALYGFNEEIMQSRAVNARRNEIAFDGFEDYAIARPQGVKCPVFRHLDFGITSANNVACSGNICVSSDKSHTGKYSLRLITPFSPVTIGKKAGKSMPATSFLSKQLEGVKITDNELGAGFAPIPGKKYVFSCWVNDNQPNTNIIQNFNLSINGGLYFPNTIKVPVVEGWKRFEVEFTAGQQFVLSFEAKAANIFIDDIRIHPADAKMNSYAYDEQTYRLMAQLDENNFATFFEYDSEGTPIRIKKETDRGIMTIKENRQFLKKRTDQ